MPEVPIARPPVDVFDLMAPLSRREFPKQLNSFKALCESG